MRRSREGSASCRTQFDRAVSPRFRGSACGFDLGPFAKRFDSIRLSNPSRPIRRRKTAHETDKTLVGLPGDGCVESGLGRLRRERRARPGVGLDGRGRADDQGRRPKRSRRRIGPGTDPRSRAGTGTTSGTASRGGGPERVATQSRGDNRDSGNRPGARSRADSRRRVGPGSDRNGGGYSQGRQFGDRGDAPDGRKLRRAGGDRRCSRRPGGSGARPGTVTGGRSGRTGTRRRKQRPKQGPRSRHVTVTRPGGGRSRRARRWRSRDESKRGGDGGRWREFVRLAGRGGGQ